MDAATENRIIQAKAIEWVMSSSIQPYSYLWICDMISATPQYLRDAIKDGSVLAWKAKVHNGLSIYRLRYAN